MYIPAHFKMEMEDSLSVIKEHSFATLFSQQNGIPVATHLPLILDSEKQYVIGHFARANPQWKDIVGQTVLAVFQGPHCYISPSWYETNKAVPTWNYVSVHVYGEVEFIDDEEEIFDYMNQLTSKYEAPDSPYSLTEVDQEYIRGMNKGIKAFKIKIDRIEGKAKLSQNHASERRERVIAELEKKSSEDERNIASLMKWTLKDDV